MSEQHNVGKQITTEKDKVYITIHEREEGGVMFEILDTLDYNKDEGRFMLCVARGMVDTVIGNTEEVVKAAAEAFVQEGFFSERVEVEDSVTEMVETIDGTVVAFPKIKGNA